MPASRTLLHLTAPARHGGLESVVTALARGQQERGHRVLVAPVIEPDLIAHHPFLEGLRSHQVPTEVIEVQPRAYITERRKIRSLLEAHEPDIVHTHGYRTDVLASPLARRWGSATVSTVHGFTRSGWKGRLYEMLQVRAYRRFDAVVAVSRPLESELARRGVSKERLHLLPNAWRPSTPPLPPQEAQRQLGVEADLTHLGWVGRLSREKGPDVFLQALSLLRDVSWTASIVGDGPELGRLEDLAHQVGLDDRVHFHGSLPNASTLMAAFDLFVLSSRTEGTPIVLLEAMAAGRPIVSTAVGGVPDLMGDAAVLVESEHPEGLAARIREFIDKPDLLDEYRDRSVKRLAERTDEERWLRGYDEVYLRALGEP